jgi:TrmH family RNA methyltransferase
MTHHPLENIVIILKGTKHPGNIGSAARAMNNMGLKTLVLADPQCEVNEESFRLAKAGEDVLARVKSFRSLKSAWRGIRMLVGTTGKTGGDRAQAYSPRLLAPRIINHAARQKVGILFGPEDTGLVDSDLAPCQMLIRIPTHPNACSINLAQAVMLVSYELFLAQLERDPARVPKLAAVEQVEAMYSQLEKALQDIGFLQEQNTKHMMFGLRRIMGRAGLETRDVGIFRGIARQIAWYSRKGSPDGR